MSHEPTSRTRDTLDPFRGAPAVAARETTRARLRGPDFHRVGPDLYVGAAIEIDIRTRVRALSEWAKGRGVVGGPLAALAWNADCPWEDGEIVVRGHRRRALPGTRVREDELRDEEVAERFGVPMTTPLRTAFDLARRCPLVDAVAAVDALAFRCGFGADELGAVVEKHPHVRGIVQARHVLTVMDPRAQSPMETRMRLLFTRPDIPPPVPQHRVYLPDGRWRDLDLGWPDVPPGRRKLGLEYDGAEHRTIAGQNRDRLRDADLDLVWWDTIRVSSFMIYDDTASAELVDRVMRRIL